MVLQEASDGARREGSGDLAPTNAEEKEGDYLAPNHARNTAVLPTYERAREMLR